MITSSDRRARCIREDRAVRRPDKDRVRARSGAQGTLREIVENQAVDKARDEEVSLAVFKAQGKGLQALGGQPHVGEVKANDKR